MKTFTPTHTSNCYMNSKQSQTTYIKDNQVLGAIEAAIFAHESGIPLTRFTTINLEPRFLKRPIRPQAFINQFLKPAGEWLGFHHSSRAYLYALENPSGKALNLHVLSHVPDHLMDAYRKMEKRWAGMAGLARVRGALKGEWINGEEREFDYACNLSRVVNYILKGARPEVCEVIGRDHACQGEIAGKRIGWSQSIGKASRDRKGFVLGRSISVWVCPNWRELQQTCK